MAKNSFVAEVTFNEKNLTRLIKEMLKEEFAEQEFAEQEENISNLVNGNFEIIMKKRGKSQDKIKYLRK